MYLVSFSHFSPEKVPVDSTYIQNLPKQTSPTHIQPSPTKMRMRKSRHRRSNSKGAISTSNSSPVKSPTKDKLHDELQSNQICLRHVDRSKVSASTFNFLGPATALREFGSPTEKTHKSITDLDLSTNSNGCDKDKNLNDVCFGCEGQCSDVTCSSKESTPSRESVADVESNTCESSHYDSTPSPSGHIENIVEFRNNRNDTESISHTQTDSKYTQSQMLSEMDSNENLKSSLVITDSDAPIIEISKGDNSNLEYSVKRNISDVEFSPSNPPSPLRLDSMEEDRFVGESGHSITYRRRAKVSDWYQTVNIIYTVI